MSCCCASDGSSSRLRRRALRAIMPGSQGRPSAARPTITRSAPDCASASRASSETVDVAVDHERDRDRVLHRAHRAPVGAALVELVAGAAMNGDELHAGILRAPREFGRIDAIAVPAEPHLQRDRHLHRRHGRLDQRERMIEIAHQRRARLPVGHVLGRAAHVDIDDVGAGILRDASALAHPARLAAGKLHRMDRDPAPVGTQHGVATAPGELCGCHHLGYDKAGAHRFHGAPKRSVGHARHRGQHDPVRQFDRPDIDGAVTSGDAHPGIFCLKIRPYRLLHRV